MHSSVGTAHRDGRTKWFVAIAGALVLAAFAPTLVRLVQSWIDRPEYSHGFLMPPIAAWLAWRDKERITSLPSGASLLGPALVAIGLLFLAVAEMRLFPFFGPYAFVTVCAGVLVSAFGARSLRVFAPALIVLLLMCPIPDRLQTALTFPLKQTAAVLATGLLDLSGIPATLEGNIIRLPDLPDLFVADACSGIRSLISLMSLAVVACFVRPRHWAKQLAIVAATIPISVFANGVRIWLTGYLSATVGPEAAADAFHTMEGFLLFAFGAALTMLWALALDFAFPERKPEGKPEGESA